YSAAGPGGRPAVPVVGVVGLEGEVDVEEDVEGLLVVGVLDQRRPQRRLEGRTVLEVDVLQRPHGVEVLGHRHRQPRRPQLVDEARQQVEHPPRRRHLERGHASATFSSLLARSMSRWYLSSTWSVPPTTSDVTRSTPRWTSVRAQSIVSEIDGAFFRSSWRMERTTRAIWSARVASMPGTRTRTMSCSRSASG